MAKSKTGFFNQNIAPILKILSGQKDLTIVLFIVIIMSIIIVPLPSVILDFFLAISLSISVLIILIALYIAKPTDLTTFPTLILIITLYRLSLNIATTRMILSKGHEGPDAVSHIVASFGNFVVGGDFVIGTIMFVILVIINFMVVTKGSGRVAEVAARFTLDAMPGKQMAIDADLNAGLIDDKQAKQRREELQKEASFYGAMDGSSKFISGDAIAGIIITLINVIGGFLIGVFMHDLSIKESAQTYTILTIGDGLVSQLPALIMSTAVGIIITRGAKDENSANFAASTLDQLGKDYRVLFIVGSIMLLFALVPGLPTFSLGFVGLSFVSLGYLIQKDVTGVDILEDLFKKKKGATSSEDAIDKLLDEQMGKADELGQVRVPKAQKTPEEIKKEEEQAIDDILKMEILELEVGYGLIKLADANQGGDLLERIRGIRRKIASDFGFLMPQIRIRDNLQLPPNVYQLKLKGIAIGDGEVFPEQFMAMSTGLVTEEIHGIPTREPAFGLDALWIESHLKEDAIMHGYTVVDPATVITTHMSELIKKHAEELLTRQDVQNLIEKLKKDFPIVVDDAMRVANTGLIQRILKALLHEKIPVKDMLTILETVADIAEYSKNIDVLVENVRARLARVITGQYRSDDGVLRLVTFSTDSEQKLLDKVRDQNGTRNLLLSVGEINALVEGASETARKVLERGIAPVIIIADPLLRKGLVDIFERFGLDVVVLSHAEIDTTAKFEVVGTIII